MKRFILLALLATVNLSAFAQDLIVLKDGNVIKSKVTEIGIQEIRYKKWSNTDGPSYVIGKSDVLSINYENGEVESFKDDQSEQAIPEHENSIPSEISALISPDNVEILSRYDSPLDPGISRPKDSITAHHAVKFAFTDDSVLSNEHVEVFFKMPYLFHYEIWIRNKTNSPIIIDLMNTFRTDSDGVSRTYYDNSETTSVTSGEGSGASVNLGAISSGIGLGGPVNTLLSGISISGGKSQAVTTTYTNERYIIIPPKGCAPISTWKSVVESTRGIADSKKWIKYGDRFTNIVNIVNRININKKGKIFFSIDGDYGSNLYDLNKYRVNSNIKVGEHLLFDTQNSPLRKDYSILYYTDTNAMHYTTISFSLYIRQVIGYNKNLYFHPNHINEYEIIGEYWAH